MFVYMYLVNTEQGIVMLLCKVITCTFENTVGHSEIFLKDHAGHVWFILCTPVI